MKSIVKIAFILFSILCVTLCVYAASCNMSLQTAKNEFEKTEEFVVDVNISNIQAEKGIIALGATLEYDKNILSLVGMSGQNSWANPSYNEANGKLVTDRGSLTSSDETVFKITFKVKENSKANTTITLKDIAVSNGMEEIKVANLTKTIDIKTASPAPKPENTTNTTNTNTTNTTPTNSTNNNGGNNNTNQNSTNNNGNGSSGTGTNNSGSGSNQNIVANTANNTQKDSVKKGILPKTGIARNVILIVIGVLLVLVVIFYIKMKLLDKKMK